MSGIDEKLLACAIDHTLLSATATEEDVKRLCEEAKEYGFGSVCVNPRWIGLAVDELEGSEVKVGSVVSLPLGADSTKMKAATASDAILHGADEVDMVADLGAIIEGNSKYLMGQINAVSKVCRSMKKDVVFKVIIEAAALNWEQKLFACGVMSKCEADFIKTSTGMHESGGATVEDVKLMKENATGCKVKAAGGIKTAKQAIEMLEAGAERLGTSSGVAIIEQFRAGEI